MSFEEIKGLLFYHWSLIDSILNNHDDARYYRSKNDPNRERMEKYLKGLPRNLHQSTSVALMEHLDQKLQQQFPGRQYLPKSVPDLDNLREDFPGKDQLVELSQDSDFRYHWESNPGFRDSWQFDSAFREDWKNQEFQKLWKFPVDIVEQRVWGRPAVDTQLRSENLPDNFPDKDLFGQLWKDKRFQETWRSQSQFRRSWNTDEEFRDLWRSPRFLEDWQGKSFRSWFLKPDFQKEIKPVYLKVKPQNFSRPEFERAQNPPPEPITEIDENDPRIQGNGHFVIEHYKGKTVYRYVPDEEAEVEEQPEEQAEQPEEEKTGEEEKPAEPELKREEKILKIETRPPGMRESVLIAEEINRLVREIDSKVSMLLVQRSAGEIMMHLAHVEGMVKELLE